MDIQITLGLSPDGYMKTVGSFIMRAPSLVNSAKVENKAKSEASDARKKEEAEKRAYKEASLSDREAAERTIKRFKGKD